MIEEQRGSIRIPFIRKKKWLFILIIIAAVAIILVLAFWRSSEKVTAIPTCGDGTFYNTCSLDKPYYCDNGILIENVSACGCPDYLSVSGNSCISIYQSGQKLLNLKYVVDGKNGSIDLELYRGLTTYLSTLPNSIIYRNGQQPVRADFKLMRIEEPNQEVLIMPLIKEIENLAPNDKVAQARIAISLVQNIQWGSSDGEVAFGNQTVGDSRYPYEVLYDNQGLCGEKSELLAEILKNIGYGTALFYYPYENHETLGIKCPVEESLRNSGYCFVETSGPSILSDSSIEYAGGTTLKSSPEIILISNGISLPSGLDEYSDAELLGDLRNQSSLGPINSYKFSQLEKKYGLSKVYNIG
jgi:predicted nucleic acid binding AN1-type Zn finger protein